MLELRLLTDDDVPLVEIWLNKEHVKRWYEIPHMGITIDDWMCEIKERNGEFRWLTYCIATWQGNPIGLCQYYKCEGSIDEEFGSLPIAGSYGIDYLIGEEEYIGKGLGKGIIGLLLEKIFSFPDAQRVTADIDKENTASEMALLSCGFELLDAEGCRYVVRKAKDTQYVPAIVESRCGILCKECEYKDKMNCGGCININKPFWGDACPVKSCCESKSLEHCGKCEDFPCDLLNQFAFDKEQGDDGKRIEQCRAWATCE